MTTRFRLPPMILGTALLRGATGLVLAFLMLPILIVVPVSFSDAAFLTFPPPGYSLRWYHTLLERQEWIDSALLSIGVGGAVVVLATSLGTLAAFGLVRARIPGRGLVLGLIISPLVVPVMVTAIGMYAIYVRMGIGGTLAGLVIAHTCLAIPFVVTSVSATLVGFDQRLEWAAMSLGAPPWTTFWHITFPIVRPGILSGALFAFITSFDELVIALFISPTTALTLPRRLWDSIRFEVDPTIAAASTSLVILTGLLLLVSELLRARTERMRSRPAGENA